MFESNLTNFMFKHQHTTQHNETQRNTTKHNGYNNVEFWINFLLLFFFLLDAVVIVAVV